jgi:lysine 2,3-aminomutase
MDPYPARQPYSYVRRPLVEPDWRRLPGWRDVTPEQWRDAQWQRAHCVKTIAQLRSVLGPLLGDGIYDELDLDRQRYGTMAMLVPPQMLNTMCPSGFTDAAFRSDPVRRYMLPMAGDRDPQWTSHPYAERDSLHETQMWVTEGLTHRYPTKVLAELVTTCPQYCGHCTRMDLVGTSTPQVTKAAFALRPAGREELMLDYLKRTPSVRDVVVSGGDVANVSWPRLARFLGQLLELESVRDIRLATKALVGLPQHWLQPSLVDGLSTVARTAAARGVHLAVHTHANHAASVTPLVAEASRALLAAGVRDVRNQGVLLRGVNDSPAELLDLCFALHGEAGIVPYYFYLCDMIPNAEHWRIAVHEAQALQEAILGYLPGYATPRLVCDVPYVGKRWVHQVAAYDRERGISYWTKAYQTAIETDLVPDRRYPYYDPIATLPESGRAWWSTVD